MNAAHRADDGLAFSSMLLPSIIAETHLRPANISPNNKLPKKQNHQQLQTPCNDTRCLAITKSTVLRLRIDANHQHRRKGYRFLFLLLARAGGPKRTSYSSCSIAAVPSLKPRENQAAMPLVVAGLVLVLASRRDFSIRV